MMSNTITSGLNFGTSSSPESPSKTTADREAKVLQLQLPEDCYGVIVIADQDSGSRLHVTSQSNSLPD